MVLWFTGCSISKVFLCCLSFFKFIIDRKKRKDIILSKIGKFMQMFAIITWMILEKCLDVGRQYFFIGFLF